MILRTARALEALRRAESPRIRPVALRNLTTKSTM